MSFLTLQSLFEISSFSLLSPHFFLSPFPSLYCSRFFKSACVLFPFSHFTPRNNFYLPEQSFWAEVPLFCKALYLIQRNLRKCQQQRKFFQQQL